MSDIEGAVVGMPTPYGSPVVVRDGEGKIVFPLQPEMPDLVVPEQVYRELPADVVFYTDEAKERARGWAPLARCVELIQAREAMRAAYGLLKARRDADLQHVADVVNGSADLIAPESAQAVATAFENLIIDDYLTHKHGDKYGPISTIAEHFERHWNELLWANQRAVLASLAGRPSPEAAKLRRLVEGMAGMGEAPAPFWQSYALR
jgi:hypothetical protein